MILRHDEVAEIENIDIDKFEKFLMAHISMATARKGQPTKETVVMRYNKVFGKDPSEEALKIIFNEIVLSL